MSLSAFALWMNSVNLHIGLFLIFSQAFPKLTWFHLFSNSSSYQYFLPTQLLSFVLTYLFIQKRNNLMRTLLHGGRLLWVVFQSWAELLFFLVCFCGFTLGLLWKFRNSLDVSLPLFLSQAQRPLSGPTQKSVQNAATIHCDPWTSSLGMARAPCRLLGPSQTDWICFSTAVRG